MLLAGASSSKTQVRSSTKPVSRVGMSACSIFRSGASSCIFELMKILNCFEPIAFLTLPVKATPKQIILRFESRLNTFRNGNRKLCVDQPGKPKSAKKNVVLRVKSGKGTQNRGKYACECSET